MKHAIFGLAFAALAGAAAPAPTPTPPAQATAAAPRPTCDGDIWVVRKSQIVPGGSLMGFVKAVNDQAAWYRANGAPLADQKIGRVMRFNAQTRQREVVEDQIVTIALQSKADNLPRRDDGWKAFSAEFKANSRIINELQVCVPAKS